MDKLDDLDEKMEKKYRLEQDMEVVKSRMEAHRLPVIWLQGGPDTGLYSHACNIAERFGYAHIDVPQEGSTPPRGVLTYIKENMIKAGDTKGYLITGLVNDDRFIKRFWQQISPIDCIIHLETSPTGDEQTTNVRYGRYDCRVQKISASEPAAEVFLRIEATILDRLAASAP